MLAMKRLLVLLACIDFCARLLYDSGYDKGFSERCVCCELGECDTVSKKTFPPMIITLKIRNDHDKKQPEDQKDEQRDDRVTREYPDE